MKKMFEKNNGRKRRKFNINEHKAVRIPELICQNNNIFFVTVNPRNTCRMDFADHLWLLFLDQTQ